MQHVFEPIVQVHPRSHVEVSIALLQADGGVRSAAINATTLALIPVMMVGGWLVVAAVPLLAVVIGLQIARRAGNYAITKPGREMLFTLVDDETRYKAKPVIDIVVYRGGDVFWGWAFTGLTQVVGLGMAAVAAVGAVIAAVWAALGLYLGRRATAGETGAVASGLAQPD